MSNVPHAVPSRLSHLTAELYGREDDTLIAWRQTCVDATDARRPQYAGERLSKALVLAQDGAVNVHDDFALVASGSAHYQVEANGRCNCADYTKRGGPCKHALAVLIHTQTLALLEPDPSPWEPEPPAPSTPPGYATVADLQRASPTSATWNVHEAPTSACFKWRVGNAELLYTFRGVSDDEVLDRIREHLPLLQDILEACQTRAAERAVERAAAQAQAQQAPAPADMPALIQQAVLQALAAQSNGASANGHATGHSNGQPKASDQERGWCSLHNVAMEQRVNDRGTWFSHVLDNGRYCKGAK